MATQREASKKEWSCRDTVEDINAGSLQRIADATEKMAGNYTRMENDLKWYKEGYNTRGEQIARLERSNAALRGHLKRLKKFNYPSK